MKISILSELKTRALKGKITKMTGEMKKMKTESEKKEKLLAKLQKEPKHNDQKDGSAAKPAQSVGNKSKPVLLNPEATEVESVD